MSLGSLGSLVYGITLIYVLVNPHLVGRMSVYGYPEVRGPTRV